MINHCPECGCILGKARSLPDHRRLFGLIKVAFANWPESHAFQPANEEQLRAYLLIKGEHARVATVEIPASYAESPKERAAFRDAVAGTSRALAGPSGYYELRVRSDAVEIITADSISFDAVGRREFGAIRDAVEATIELAIGVPAEQLLREQAA